MNDNNSKCREYGSNVEESLGGGGGGASGLPNRNVEAHVVSSRPPRGPECPDIRRGNVIFICAKTSNTISLVKTHDVSGSTCSL